MKLATYSKQPVEVKDYDIDFSPWLSESADTLDTVTTAVECQTDPTDTSLQVDRVQYTVDRAKVWVSGGTDGQTYKVTVTVSTAADRVDQSELIFKIKEV